MTFTATLSYSVSLAANWGGLRQQICTSLAAFSAGIVGNIHARLTDYAPTVPVTAGL